jgi:hypothetical protein
MTDPLYSAVASRVESWWGYLERQVGDVKITTTQSNRTTTSAAQCTPAETTSSQSSRTQVVETRLNCPAECSDKCVLEKQPGKAPKTRCLRAPSCPVGG